MKTAPAFPSSTATPAERDFYAAPDDGRIHVLVTRQGKGSSHVVVPIMGPDTRARLEALVRRFFGDGQAAEG